jgi:glycine cleavage system transcriptional repressor
LTLPFIHRDEQNTDMKQFLILSAVGRDRPGIVNEVSKLIYNHGGNMEDSRMAALGGDFALIVLVSGEPETIARLHKDFPAFTRELGLTGASHETPGPQARVDKGFVPYDVRAVGLDHQGIVHRIAQVLLDLGANVITMDTESVSAPVTGAPMFTLDMRVAVPPAVTLPQLRSKLQATGDALNVDVTVQAA